MLEIYENYRDAKPIDQPHYGHRRVNFDFLGIWDTVGALAFGSSIGGFHRINPGHVLRVAHALALDEERERFQPSYWDKPDGANTEVNEVWFSGCHTNIGGGYCDTNVIEHRIYLGVKGCARRWNLDRPARPPGV